MLGVVEEGTGASAAVEGYAVGGKTGTAEKLPRGNGKYLVSFIGYAPQENPQVMVYVVRLFRLTVGMQHSLRHRS